MRNATATSWLAALLLAFATGANEAAAQASVGISAGGISTKLSGDDIGDDFESDGGFFVVGGMSYPLNERFGWGWNVSYEQRGWIETNRQEVEVEYVGIGLGIGTGHQLAERVGVGVGVGPRILFKAKCENKKADSVVNCDDGGNINPYGIDYEVVGNGGIGYTINEQWSIGLGASYRFGLRPLAQYQNGPRAGEDWEARWRGYTIGAGLQYSFGGG